MFTVFTNQLPHNDAQYRRYGRQVFRDGFGHFLCDLGRVGDVLPRCAFPATGCSPARSMASQSSRKVLASLLTIFLSRKIMPDFTPGAEFHLPQTLASDKGLDAIPDNGAGVKAHGGQLSNREL